MKTLYPEIEPFESGMLKVSDIHEIYWERVGNPEGIPVVFLHGGPGGGLIPMYRQFFDPEAYHVILFDQRGSGQSTPHAELRENTTWDLISDIEALREKFGIDKWYVFGGSWGSTLSLAYGINHPDRCLGLILRGIFLTRKKELDWFYQYGASEIFPDFWERYRDAIPDHERGDFMTAYHKRLTSDNETVRLSAARAWSTWEGATSKLFPDQELVDHWEGEHEALSLARIESHYFVNGSFFPGDNYLLDNVNKIRHLPIVIVQGRYDVVCPMRSAWELHQALPEADFIVVPDSGHSVSEKGITSALVDAMDRLRTAGL
ncbi:MAG TPA: prolyl aminopeptidase [Pyrinomonadaceae bacterium]|nr:prolyl aminopeptidase [Pyrinomonadaceae bacterium]HMP64291.1 prolyl aminopeptidase [Pyrinomonadaceae bacterium]